MEHQFLRSQASKAFDGSSSDSCDPANQEILLQVAVPEGPLDHAGPVSGGLRSVEIRT